MGDVQGWAAKGGDSDMAVLPANIHFTEVKDSGRREEFETGSRRDTQEGKPRYELVPILPQERLAMHYTNGAEKYGDHNWKLGQPASRFFSSLERHVKEFAKGNQDEDHLAAIAWNAFALMHFEGQNWLAPDGTNLNDLAPIRDEATAEELAASRDKTHPGVTEEDRALDEEDYDGYQ